MKKALIISIVLLLLFSMIACGKKNQKQDGSIDVESRTHTGAIELESDFSGEIYLDDEYMKDISPSEAITLNDVPVGEHTVTLEYAGKTLTQEITVNRNEKSFHSFKESIKSIKMTRIDGGSFWMGDRDGESDELPVHQVNVSSFLMGTYQITQKEWQSVMGYNPSRFKGDNLPVDNIDWYEAVKFCNKLSSLEGLTPCYSGSGVNTKCNWNADGYRLPTEAEWEFAATGGNNSNEYTYSGSGSIGSIGWYSGNAGGRTKAVGSKKPNELGIHDMTGNVWEWCWDWHDEYYYSNSPSRDPKGADSGKERVFRGGAYNSAAVHCRSANRGFIYPDKPGNIVLGLRVAKKSR